MMEAQDLNIVSYRFFLLVLLWYFTISKVQFNERGKNDTGSPSGAMVRSSAFH